MSQVNCRFAIDMQIKFKGRIVHQMSRQKKNTDHEVEDVTRLKVKVNLYQYPYY